MKINKFFKCLIATLMILMIFSNITMIFATSGINPKTTHVASFQKAMKVVIGIAEVITTGVAIITLIALAIKYMSSATSDKAEVKKHAVVYLVGACLAFGATGILSLLNSFVDDALKTK